MMALTHRVRDSQIQTGTQLLHLTRRTVWYALSDLGLKRYVIDCVHSWCEKRNFSLDNNAYRYLALF